MPFGDLAQALAMQAISLDGCLIQFQRSAADALAFEADAPHAGAHPLHDKVALEFGDGANDDDDSPAQRAGGVDIFSERDVLDVEPVEFVEHIEEVLHRPGQSIRSPDQNGIELAAAGIGHHLMKAWPPGLGSGDPVSVFVDDGVAAPPSAGGRATGSPGVDRLLTPACRARRASRAPSLRLRRRGFAPGDIVLDELQ